jgi:4-carboxymuconolactone decarboxylase
MNNPTEVFPNDERHRRGLQMLQRVDGEAGVAVVDRLAVDFPDFARLLVEFPFGDIYARPGLSLQRRELCVVAMLTAMGTASPQLKVHVHAALHVGCDPHEVVEAVMQTAVYAGFPAALNGLGTVREVFTALGIQLPLTSTPDPTNPPHRA